MPDVEFHARKLREMRVKSKKSRDAALGHVRALAREGAVEELVKYGLRHPDELISKESAEALGVNRNPKAAGLVVEHGLGSATHNVILRSLEALGGLRDKRATKHIVRIGLSYLNEDILSASLKALGRIGDRRAVKPIAERCLENRREDVILDAVHALLEIGGDEAVKEVVEHGFSISADGVKQVIEGLQKAGTRRAIHGIIEKGLTHQNMAVQISSDHALRQLQSKATKELIEFGLSHPDLRVRYKSKGMLGVMDDALESFYIKKMMRRKDYVEAVKTTPWVIGQAKSRKAAELIIKNGLTQKSMFVREASIKALGDNRHAIAVPRLIEYLYQNNRTLAMAAAESLGKIGDKRALPHLMMLADHPHELLKGKAKRAIRMIQEAAKHA